MHRRVAPEQHEFSYRMSQVWIDPDHPAELCDLHPAWSHRRLAPARFRRSDYGARPTGSLADEACDDLARLLGRTPAGPVRMLSQVRRWGWLFNPITFFFVWDHTETHPVGAVLEVTNTPWKERTRYPLVLEAVGEGLTAEFDKALHVSPFLGMDHRYRLTVQDRDEMLMVDIDVAEPGGRIVLHTKLRLQRGEATRQLLGRSLSSQPFPTHRVSAGIHAQAVRLRAKGLRVFAHPRKNAPADAASDSRIEETL